VYAAARQVVYTSIGLFAGVEALESWRRHEVLMTRWLGGVAAAMALMLVVSSVLSRPKSR
jgi:putative copper export protein